MDTAMKQLFKDSLDQIVEYATLDTGEEFEVMESLWSYVGLKDKQGSSDACRMLRKDATKAFATLYRGVFISSLSKKMTLPVLLFLYFGFVSETVITEDELSALCVCARELQTSDNIYTFCRWLKDIYSGEKTNSVNEFSMDFRAYLVDQVKNGYLTKQEALQWENDPIKRVDYEIENMMISTMRMVSQSVLRFCPVLISEDILGAIPQSFLTQEKVSEAIAEIEKKDCTIFYRNHMYSNPAIGVDKAYLFSRIAPDVILLPGAGVKGVMWQEVAGSNRSTPARFAMPILLSDNLQQTLIPMCATYRWEYCKRVEGSRWMDVSTHSLTSEYYDYVTNYRQNRDLSPDTKEKLKQEIAKNNKNPRNVFVADYAQYMIYEAEGAIKLNKVARELLFRYCPLSKETIGGRLKNNVLYDPLINQRNNKLMQEKKLCNALCQKIEQKGKEIPDEIVEHVEYFDL